MQNKTIWYWVCIFRRLFHSNRYFPLCNKLLSRPLPIWRPPQVIYQNKGQLVNVVRSYRYQMASMDPISTVLVSESILWYIDSSPLLLIPIANNACRHPCLMHPTRVKIPSLINLSITARETCVSWYAIWGIRKPALAVSKHYIML